MINITRWYLPDVTLGELTLDNSNFKCFTLELPWKLNESNVSCIPEDGYDSIKHRSTRNGDCIWIKDVEDRTHIQIHSGNWAHQIKGCILVGEAIKHSHNGLMVTNSRRTLKHLLGLLPETFNLKIG